MAAMMNRLSLITTLERAALSLSLINEYDSTVLLRESERIERLNLRAEWYRQHHEIQRLLIEEPDFADCFAQMVDADVQPAKLENLIQEMERNHDDITRYSSDRLVRALNMTTLNAGEQYRCLRHYLDVNLSPDQIQTLETCLRKLRNEGDYLPNLDGELRGLLSEAYMASDDIAPPRNFAKVCRLFLQYPALKGIAEFLFTEGVSASWDLVHYQTIAKSSEQAYEKLLRIYGLLGQDPFYMSQFVGRWLENNAALYDLQTVEKRLRNMDEVSRARGFKTRSGYVDMLFGGKISGIPLDTLPRYQEDLLIYAISNRKTRFLRLVEENLEAFNEIGRQSLLFNRDFYVRYINLNTLNAADLKRCGQMVDPSWDICILKEAIYTFAEIKALYGLPRQYLTLYNLLEAEKIDKRLLIIRQLAKHKALEDMPADGALECLAPKLCEKPLSAWMENDFAHISGLRYANAARLLAVYDRTSLLIPQMQSWHDAMLVIHNTDGAAGFSSLNELKTHLLSVDSAWAELKHALDIGDDFIEQHRDRITVFVCENGARMLLTYYKGCDKGYQREAVRRLVKAELMGEFLTLKYFGDDLKKEIEYPVTPWIKSAWTENLELASGSFTVQECDDLLNTFRVGTMPQRTCLSYSDGKYKDCLLSCFDSNKKILYARRDGEIVGRAILRLTKGRFSPPTQDRENATSLRFADLENIEPEAEIEAERLALFLERPYTSTLSPNEEAQMRRMFVELVERKAEALNCALILSDNYSSYAKPGNFTRTLYHLFISKSKAGAQYIDSLGGAAYVEKEGSYKSNCFLVQERPEHSQTQRSRV